MVLENHGKPLSVFYVHPVLNRCVYVCLYVCVSLSVCLSVCLYVYVYVCVRAAAMTLRTVLLSLQALLSAAEPDDPQDAVVAKQFKEQPEMFRKTARHWANTYAGGLRTKLLSAVLNQRVLQSVDEDTGVPNMSIMHGVIHLVA